MTNLLSLLILLPLAGALACFFSAPHMARRIGVATAVLELVLSLVALDRFDPLLPGFQLLESRAWIPSLGLEFLFGIDGISVLFLPMTALLTLAVQIHGWQSWPERQSAFMGLLLLLEAATMGIFTALDTVLFFLFWELTLPPLFFLISRFGDGPERRGAALKYVLYMLCGGVPLLFAFVMLAINHLDATGTSLSFSLPQLLETPVAVELQRTLFLLLLLGFGVKAPLFPLHAWLAKVALEGPAQVTALLVGLKLGVYGFLRFMLPLLPDALAENRRLLAALGALTLIYAAFCALRQTNFRTLLAYAGISHVGLVVMGLASLTAQGVQGAIFQLFNFTLVASALMLIAASLQQRLGSTELLQMSGLASVMPRLATLCFFFALASLGAPVTSGFPAELLILIGNFSAHPGLGLTALGGAIIGAAALLLFLRRALWGPLADAGMRFHDDLLPREYLLLLAFTVLVLVVGLFPNLILDLSGPATAGLLTRGG